MEDLYREMILDHSKNPRNKGLVNPANINYEESNPLCGDHLHLTLQVDGNNVITAVGWDGDGCAISQASASMLYESLLGKSLEEARTIDKQEILDLLGISLNPMRLKCALLSLKVLKAGAYGLHDWHEEDGD